MNFVAPEPTKEDLLITSIQQGKTSTLEEYIMEKGLDAIEQIKFGESEMNLLHISCYYGNVQCCLRLLEYFPLELPTKLGGNTCAHLAAMNGHEQVVQLLVSKGASVLVKNSKGQNVFDVAQGLQLRQTLMTLVLQEEQRTGQTPQLSIGGGAGGVSITRDMSKEQERLRNLPPPPTSFGVPSDLQQQGPRIPVFQQAPPSLLSRPPIQPDGFVTTVGNPNLAAKYGNQTQARLATDPLQQQQQQASSNIDIGGSGPTTNSAWTPPAYIQPQVNTAARYVVNTPGFNVVPSVRPQSNVGAYRLPAGPYANKVNVFNPTEFAAASTEQLQSSSPQPVPGDNSLYPNANPTPPNGFPPSGQ
jgi:hypothetical protein